MKKFVTISFTMILTLTIVAQPTFNSTVMGSIGESWTWTQWDAEGFISGSAGANVTWDFSDIDITGPSFIYKNVNPAATPYAVAFGLATMATTTDDMNYGYIQVTPEAYNNLGAGTDFAVISYTNPETILIFPLTYDVENDDTFEANYTSVGFSFNRTGDVHMEADGYGTLILPSGTFTNVLRVKVEEDYSDVSIGLPVPVEIDYNFDTYYWLAEGVTGPLISYGMYETTTFGGSTTVESGFLNDDAEVGVYNMQLPESLVHVYPNPASDILNIEISSAIDFEYISLYDITGRLITQTTELNKDVMQLHVSDLPSGIYTLQLVSEAGTLSKTICIE